MMGFQDFPHSYRKSGLDSQLGTGKVAQLVRALVAYSIPIERQQEVTGSSPVDPQTLKMITMLIQVIKNVTNNRLGNNGLGSSPLNNTVQLSELFMSKFIDELNSFIGMSVFKNNPRMYEIKWMYWGKEWIIRHRSFHDNTNDTDVEEELYKLLVQ